MKQNIQLLCITAAFVGSLSLARAQYSDSTMQSQEKKMTGSATNDPMSEHMQAMMTECMRMNKNESMCNETMQKCTANMKAPECEKIHKGMKKTK